MNVIDAAYRVGHEYPGGAGLLADRMGIVRAVFNSKLNPNTHSHHLTLAESVRMQQLAGRTDILQAMATELGHVAIPLPEVSDENIPAALARTCAEFGDYMRLVDDSLRDGRVSPNEAKCLEKELTEMVAASTHLLAVLKGEPGMCLK